MFTKCASHTASIKKKCVSLFCVLFRVANPKIKKTGGKAVPPLRVLCLRTRSRPDLRRPVGSMANHWGSGFKAWELTELTRDLMWDLTIDLYNIVKLTWIYPMDLSSKRVN